MLFHTYCNLNSNSKPSIHLMEIISESATNILNELSRGDYQVYQTGTTWNFSNYNEYCTACNLLRSKQLIQVNCNGF